jgi:GntR family transcriptional regulator
MLVRIDPNDATPLYTQIASQLRRSIAEGRLQVGERLPAARELAEALEVNMHTVLRAYDELRKDGVLEVRRGRGVVVLGSARGRAKLTELARRFLAEGTRQGLNLRELKRMLEESDAQANTT